MNLQEAWELGKGFTLRNLLIYTQRRSPRSQCVLRSSSQTGIASYTYEGGFRAAMTRPLNSHGVTARLRVFRCDLTVSRFTVREHDRLSYLVDSRVAKTSDCWSLKEK